MRSKYLSPFMWLSLLIIIGSSCSTAKNFTTKFYYEHEATLNKIEQSYKSCYEQHPFTIVFTDKQFSTLSIEIITDTLIYIYQFDVHETRLADTLNKYRLNTVAIIELIAQMKAIHCLWLNNLDYYVDERKRSVVLISIKPVSFNSPFAYKKYYILSYFSQPQYFDEMGRLLVKRKLRKIHKINGEIFRRINDKICYTISGRFR